MKNKRITFLLGAGAAIPWGGPTTSDITDLVLEKCELKTSSGQNVVQYLLNLLKEVYCFKNKEKINFETIVSFLESLYEYYHINSLKSPHPEFDVFWPMIYSIKDEIENELFKHYYLQFCGSGGTTDDEDFVYIINKNNNRKVKSLPCARIGWKVQVIAEIYAKIISTISHRIWDYSLNASENYNRDTKYLLNFVSKLLDSQIIVRFYTTNYDRLLPHIFEGTYKVFDGFTDLGKIEESYRFEHKKTLNNFDTLCYYNLHGSIYWEEGSTTDLSNKEFILSSYFSYQPYGTPTFRVDAAKEVMFSNILVGFDKPQKIFIPPLNYFDYTFGWDCVNSECIIIVGSSLGDYNIRKLLYTALSDRKKRLVIIDKEEGINIERFSSIIRDLSPTFGRSLLSKSSVDHWYKSDENNCFVYTNGFVGFLESEAWKDLDFVS